MSMRRERGILALWGDLVDPRTGIVAEVKQLLVDDDEPRFVHYLSRAAHTEAFGYLDNFGNNGGVGMNADTAIAKALGEAVERYCGAMFDYDDLQWASYAELGAPATPPHAFALYSDEQYAEPDFTWRRFTEQSTVAWVPGRSLVSGGEVLIPATFVYVPFHYFQRSRGDTPIAQPISTGLACGTSIEDATRSALCEVIERDAFTLTWQTGASRRRVASGGLPDDVEDAVDRFGTAGIAVHLMDIGRDVACPTILSVAEGFAHGSPALAVAAATHPDAATAARKSMEELAHTRKFAAQVMDYLPPVPVDIPGGHPSVDNQRAHLRFYCPQDSKQAAGFLWAAEDECDLDEIPAPRDLSLAALVEQVAATGEDVIAVDLTTPDIADLGLSVVRVVVPGFHPLHMGHANRALGGRRFAEAIAEHPRWQAFPDNPYPHPFP